MPSITLQTLTPDEETLLLAITTPPTLLPDELRSAKAADPIRQAHFLTRPDVQPHLDALQSLAALRDSIRANHLTHQAAEILLDVARKTDDLVEKRRAATAILRLVRFLESAHRPPRKPHPGIERESSAPESLQKERSLAYNSEPTPAPRASSSPANQPTNQSSSHPASPTRPSAGAPASIANALARVANPGPNSKPKTKPKAATKPGAASEAATHARSAKRQRTIGRDAQADGRTRQRGSDRAPRNGATTDQRRSRVRSLAGAAGSLTPFDSS